MQQNSYAEYLPHKEDHEELLDQIREMMDKVRSDPGGGIATLRQELADWFLQHFSSFDAALHGKLQIPH
jgi:hemerythrin